MQRKLKPKPVPSLTPDQIAAQVSARITELSAPRLKALPSVKVKSHAELQSSKIARLTTKIAVTEVEIERLKKEQSKAQEAVQKSLEIQKSAALAILERRVALEKAIQDSTETNNGAKEKEQRLREELEASFSAAKKALANGHPEHVPQILGQTSQSLTKEGVLQTGQIVMDQVLKLFERMEKDAEAGTVSEGAKLVLDALATKPVGEVGEVETDNEAILEAFARALSLEEGNVKR